MSWRLQGAGSRLMRLRGVSSGVMHLPLPPHVMMREPWPGTLLHHALGRSLK